MKSLSLSLCSLFILSFLSACDNRSSISSMGGKSGGTQDPSAIIAEMEKKEQKLKADHGVTMVATSQKTVSTFKKNQDNQTYEEQEWSFSATITNPNLQSITQNTPKGELYSKVKTLNNDLWAYALSYNELAKMEKEVDPQHFRKLHEAKAKAEAAGRIGGLGKLRLANDENLLIKQALNSNGVVGVQLIGDSLYYGMGFNGESDLVFLQKSIIANEEMCSTVDEVTSYKKQFHYYQFFQPDEIAFLDFIEGSCDGKDINGGVRYTFAGVDVKEMTLAEIKSHVQDFNTGLIKQAYESSLAFLSENKLELTKVDGEYQMNQKARAEWEEEQFERFSADLKIYPNVTDQDVEIAFAKAKAKNIDDNLSFHFEAAAAYLAVAAQDNPALIQELSDRMLAIDGLIKVLKANRVVEGEGVLDPLEQILNLIFGPPSIGTSPLGSMPDFSKVAKELNESESR